MEEKEGRLESRKDKILGKIKLWFKNPYNKTLFFILLIALAIRLFYFFMVKQQPLWMDEAEYMAQAKRMAFGYDWHWKWSVRKPILMSFVFSILYRIGFNEMGLRFLMLLTSVLAVYLTYVVAADFFDKRVGLIAAFLMSTWWVHLFFTVRLLTWLPASTLLLASLHFFYLGYIKKVNQKYLWLSGALFSLSFLTRVTAGIFAVLFLFYVLLEDKWRFVKNKHLWIAAILALLVTVPFFIWLSYNYSDDPIGQFIGLKYGRFEVGTGAGEEMGAMGFKGIIDYFKDLPNVLQILFFLLLLFGLVFILADLFLGFDLIFKKDYQHLRFYFFALAWIILPIAAYGISRSYVEQRDTMAFSVFLFSIIGIGTMKLYDLIKKHSKVMAVITVISLLAIGTYLQLINGYNMINTKKDSYAPVRDAGLWISQQDNQPTDTIISKALPQISYYSELSSKDIPSEEKDMTQVLFDNNARYFVDSTFEPYWLIPEWSYTWGQRNPELATPVWFWADNPTNPSRFVVVYEINRKALKDYLLGLNETSENNQTNSST